MARLEGVDLPRDKRVEIALTYIYGIGLTRSQDTIEAVGIDPDTRINELTDAQITGLPEIINTERPKRWT